MIDIGVTFIIYIVVLLIVAAFIYKFLGAEAFNQNIGGWNVSKVTDMSYMVSLDYVCLL